MVMLNKKTFILTGVIGILLVGVSSTLILVKNTFGSSIFDTSNKDCVPYNVFVKKGDTDYSVTISWSTRKECVGFVQYGNSRDELDLVAVDLTNKTMAKSHSVIIDQLFPTQKYYFLINSNESSYGYNGTALDFSLSSL